MNKQYIYRHLNQAIAGKILYNRIIKENHIGYFSKKEVIFFFPESNKNLIKVFLQNVSTFEYKYKIKKIVFVIVDDMSECFLNTKYKCIYVTRGEMNNVMKLYSLYNFDNRVRIVALDVPNRRNGFLIKNVPFISYEDIVNVCFLYKLQIDNYIERGKYYLLKENCHIIAKRLMLLIPAKIICQLYFKRKLWHGIQLYDENKLNFKNQVFTCNYKGTGDNYLAISYLKDYITKNNINNYALLVVGTGNVRITSLFDIKNVMKITEEKMNSLQRASVFFESYFSNVKFLHWDPPQLQTGIWDRMRNVGELNFINMFDKLLFGDKKVKRENPQFENCWSECYDYFTKNNLKIGKTVIIAPHSYTLPTINKSVWERVVVQLSDRGYDVCTNCSGKNEKPIKGTQAIFFPYNKAETFLKMAGYFIGVRSGLNEVISSIEIPQIIIYLKNEMINDATSMQYFSLKNLLNSCKLHEIEYTLHDENDMIVNQILSTFYEMVEHE